MYDISNFSLSFPDLIGTVEKSNEIIIYYEDRAKIGCSDGVFTIGLSYNEKPKIIKLDVYRLDNQEMKAELVFNNPRYKAPTIQLVNNQYALSYKDQTFEIIASENIYVEMVKCGGSWFTFEEVQKDGTKREILYGKYIFYDTLNATTANYSVTGSQSSLDIPQYMIKYQQYSSDKTIPYNQIYSTDFKIDYYQQDERLIFKIPRLIIEFEYSSIQFYIIIGRAEEIEFIKCHSKDHYSNKAQITYYKGTATKNIAISVDNFDPSFNYAIAYVQITINGVKITKLIGNQLFEYSIPTNKSKYELEIKVLIILIALIELFLIILAIIRCRMYLKKQKYSKQALADSEQALIKHDGQIKQLQSSFNDEIQYNDNQ